MKTERLLNIEVLRILCMLFIVAGHIGNRSAILPYEQSSFATIAPHCVDCFFIISGYFLISSRFKFERILKILIETIFYSFIITLVLYLIGGTDTCSLLKSVVPIYNYWFVNKYLAIILLSPFISKLCTSLNKRMYQVLIISLLLLSSTLFRYFPFACLFGDGFSLQWVVTAFITGGYIKLHGGSQTGCWGIRTIILLVIYNLCRIYAGSFIYLGYNSLITYSLAITTFMWFKGLHVKGNSKVGKVIAFLSPHVFAAYLIHEQPYLRELIKAPVCSLNEYLPSIITVYLYAILIIFTSALIDKCRITFMRSCKIESLIKRISNRIDNIYYSQG